MEKTFLLILVLGFIFLYSEETGLTVNIPDFGNSVEGRAKTYTPTYNTESSDNNQPVNREEWEIIDSLKINKLLSPGNHLGAYYDNMDNSLKVISNQGELTSESVAAVNKSPNWIKADLENVLSQLSIQKQLIWANVINEAIDPYIDEIAFTIANLSVQHLESDFSYTQLVSENAELIYDIDEDLNYVEVLDYGTSLTDGDYYSTTRYWKEDANGVLQQIEVPRDIYYWYIVHPKITDEIPSYIDPAHSESNSTHNNNIADPPLGMFWRNFLYNHNDAGYPKLKYMLQNCDIAWNGTNLSADNAVGATENWIAQSMVFTSDNERPHQPVRIYRKHIGRCGEHADLRAAALRIALIPGTSILTISTDHTWNEFWDEEWIHYDGGSVNNPLLYENGWGKVHASVFEIRSDGVLNPVSERYSGEYATFTMYAFDGEGTPIDGARFILGVRDGTDIRFDNAGYTDKEGKYVFTVGEGREYLAKMQSVLGDDPISGAYAQLVENAEAGEEYAFQFTSWDPMPTVPYSAITPAESTTDDYKIMVEYDVPTQVVSGDVIMDDVHNSVFYHSMNNGSINFFMADLIWFSNYYAGFAFDTFNNVINMDSGSADFDVPYGDWWYAFFDNSYRLNNPQKIIGDIKLYNYDNAAGLATISGSVSDVYSSQPIENAEVYAGVYSTTTNENGEFSLEVAPHTYDVVTIKYGYESSTVWNIQISEGEEITVNPQLTESALVPQNISAEINENNLAEISWETPLILNRRKQTSNRDLLGYNIYAGLCSETDTVSEWISLETSFAGTVFTDEGWNDMEPGIYKFAVEAVYSEDVSPKAFSNDLINNMTAAVEINISTNSGDSAEDAVITLINQDNHPSHQYSVLPDEMGNALIGDVWKGTYTLNVTTDFFESYIEEDLEIYDDTSIGIVLIEILSGISELSVLDYHLTWEAAPSDRELLEYKVFVDEVQIGTVQQGGIYSWDLSAYTGDHTAGVTAVYTTGESQLAEIEFENGSSTYMGIYAYYPFSGNLNDESGNGFDGEMIGELDFLEDIVNGQSLYFNAEAEYVNCPNVFAEAPEAFTVSWWLNPASHTAWNQQIRSPDGWGGFVYHTTPEGSAYVGTSVNTRLTPSNFNEGLVLNEWNYLTFTYANGAGKMYKNGDLIGSKTDLADPTAWNGLWIGCDSANTIDGFIDEVRLYNRALATAEVEQLFLDFIPYWGTLEGTVVSAEDQTPVEGAVISAGIFLTQTDENGYYNIDVAGGLYAFVECTVGDFDTEVAEEIMVNAGSVVQVDFSYNFTGAEEELQVTNCNLHNFPNPFNPTTTISFSLTTKDKERMEIDIYNVKGQNVKTIPIFPSEVEGCVVWGGDDNNGNPVSSGIYFYKLIVGGIPLDSKKMLLLK